MAPRSSWKGFLRLSLVSVPVKAFTAHATGSEIRLNQLHKDCNSPIKYRKVCPNHGELQSDEIVSGYQYAKGQYVVIEPEELAKLRRQSDKAIQIEAFYPADALDPSYYSGRTYYLVPDGPVGQKAYALLRHVMEEKGVAALAKIVLSNKEQIVWVRPLEKLLAASVLSYASDVKDASIFDDEVSELDVAEDEVVLTETLVDATTQEELDLSQYRNAYVEQLTELIEAKVAGKQIVEAPQTEEPQIIELMDALKQSVANVETTGAAKSTTAKKKVSASKSSAKKMAPSTAKRSQAKKSKKKSG